MLTAWNSIKVPGVVDGEGKEFLDSCEANDSDSDSYSDSNLITCVSTSKCVGICILISSGSSSTESGDGSSE